MHNYEPNSAQAEMHTVPQTVKSTSVLFSVACEIYLSVVKSTSVLFSVACEIYLSVVKSTSVL